MAAQLVRPLFMSLSQPFLKILTEQLPIANPSGIELIQPLWNDYGYCVRCTLKDGDKVVVKIVTLPDSLSSHPKGWSTKTSHRRKIRSFDVEMSFYQLFSTHPSLPPLPRPHKLTKLENGWLFALSDLAEEGYTQTTGHLTVTQSYCVLDWLARFHAVFFNQHGTQLWEQGSYWHLNTRQDELTKTQNPVLKAAANTFDNLLATCPYQTVIHGDAKVANFCFSPDFMSCAAVDFQYTGRAPGIVDVAYFLGSALHEEDQLNYWEDCLQRYFATLKDALPTTLNPLALESKWRELYPIACADFHRFLSGWSPEHAKINQHLIEQTAEALKLIE
ncbi:phosphotransferase [Alteromonas sp. ASW11-130]|uniref:phosphotransferase n=1 Tax=Alteromonas sp. ASW11-130 TaxID=3015775 RepID=UPI002242466F|nr:phosphotransferase [Alteromonas sp. ASW11-130]MCW8092004.1 ecdysteroid 22-kinase family protein [Alteromonas sp. ASW11-130]